MGPSPLVTDHPSPGWTGAERPGSIRARPRGNAMPPIARRALLAGAARLVVPALAEALGRRVVVENRGGGGTLIGAEAVATAAPDGNTIGFFTITTAALAPALHPKLRFDIRRAFAPLSLVGTMPMLLVVGPHVPARALPELLALL